MRKPDPTEQALDALRLLRDAGDHAETLRQLPAFLRNKSCAVVARAAELAGNTRDIELAQELVQTFRRILPTASKRDPGCRALTNIARALVQMEASAAEVYYLGVRYQQWEASYGPAVDTADGLRAASALGLVGMRHPEGLLACCELLTDHAGTARVGAVRALGFSGSADAELVLRFKARIGDEKGEVVAETFAALLRLGPRVRSVPFVAEFLGAQDDELAESAALALGEARLKESVPPLREAFLAGGTLARTGAILMALALTGDEEAAQFCLDQFEHGGPGTAAQALQALAIHKNDAMLRQKVRALLDTAQNLKWEAIWGQFWEGDVR